MRYVMKTYHLHNTSRSVRTRSKRYQAAQHRGLMQRLAGGEVVVRRARPTAVTEGWLERNLREVSERVQAGLLEVRTPAGQLVDVSSMQAAPPPAPTPQPHPPLDSIANDKPGPSLPMRESMGQPSVSENVDIPDTLLADKEAAASETLEPEMEESMEADLEELGEDLGEGSEPSSPKGKSSRKKSRK